MRIPNRPVLSRTAHALVLSAAASLALLLILVAGSDSIVQAQTPDTPTPEATQGPGGWDGVENLPPIEGKLNPPKYPNMDSNLNRIVEQVQTGQFSAQAAAANAPLSSDESVAVTIYITEGFAAAIVDFLESNGASPRNVATDYIEAYVPVSLLPDTSEQDGVISVRTIIPPQPAQGTTSSEAASAHGATAWHSAGFKGQGVRIGIIDIGFSGFRVLMGSELPSSVEARCYTDVGIFTANLTDCETGDDPHGTAVTEAAFDIAPEATYYIANPFSAGDLANVVAWMTDHDVDIINHSVGWTWSGRGDGTSPYSNSTLKTVDAAVAAGITWVNSAGNSATTTWFGDFSDSNDNGFHNFTENDVCNTFNVEEGDLYIWAFLRWDDAWQGTTEDLDLQLYRVFTFTGTTLRIPAILAGGATIQDGESGDIPFEEVYYEISSAGTYCLAIGNYSDTPPGWIQLQTWSPQQELEHYTLHHSIGEPADSANLGLVAVGAADILDTSTIEEFSSQGPTPDDRVKPDIVGADKVHSAAFGELFSGTSQASPHVAGLAALVKQRFPDYPPHQVTNYLKSHAEARGSVPNNTWGYGFAKLIASDAATPTPSPTVTPEPTPEPTVTPEPTATPEPAATPEPTPTPLVDTCVETISADGTVNGSWDTDCLSKSRDGSYASYYTFALSESAEVTITLESTVDTYLYLRQGAGRDGDALHENDDHDAAEFTLASSTDSGISGSLDAGDYTIEATTYDAGTTGEFSLSVSGLPATVETQPTPEPTITITFGDLNWSSAMLQNRIAQYITEKGYGYSTNVEFGATLPLFNALRNGDIDVLMEVWLPNQEESWEEALAAEEVSSPGSSLGTDWQSAFVIPKYLQEQYPELDSVDDLKEEQYKSLFATDETDGKALLVSCVIGWLCEVINAEQIEGYGLSEHVHIVNPGDGAALNADITEAYESGEPWLGYQWGTNDPALRLDLVRLEEPAYSDECWSTTKACAYQDATILIAVNAGLSESAADFVDVLTEWDFSVEEVYKPIVRWQMENPDANTEDAAMWWLRGSNELWNEWVTEDAAASIQAALDAGETPEGWREEPSITPEPTPAPTDPCVETLTGSTTTNGSWSIDCVSVTRGSGSDTYARFYAFTLNQATSVSITLTSETDTFLYIREGEGRDGTILHENDDHDSNEFSLEASTDSGIAASLDAGTYTIEATTFDPSQSGDFTLVVNLAGTIPQPPQDVSGVVVSAGPNHACSINSVGEISCQGVDDSGQVSNYPPSSGFTAISVGGEHSCAIDADGNVKCWGSDDSGQVSGHPTSSGFFAISVGAKHSCAIDADGNVECWGSDEYGQSSAPSQGVFVAIDSGANYTCGSRSDDVMECWGRFEVVDGTTSVPVTPSPTPTPSPILSAATDRAVLIALHAAVGGANWTNTANWLSGAPLNEWHGVTTDSSGRVTELRLQHNGLIGQLPAELGNLTELINLHLGFNELTGEIPSQLGRLSNAQGVFLHNNSLSGSIPTELGNLSNLIYLDVGHNHQLTGEIPAQLGELVNLKKFDVGSNRLTGEIPTALGRLVNLERLTLGYNKLTGTIPSELYGLVDLKELVLDTNMLTGHLSADVGNLSELEILTIFSNQLRGELPQSLTRLAGLKTFLFNSNLGLCAPVDDEFQGWLQSIEKVEGSNCSSVP